MRIRKRILLLGLALASSASAFASTVTLGDPQAGGISYKYTVQMGGLDNATFSNHVGAWSWEDNSLFNEANGEAPVGWTHTSNWVAVNLSVTSVLKVRLERDATVPWPAQDNPDRLASVASMYPSFTLWKGWDNDIAPAAFQDGSGTPVQDFHTYNNRGPVAWAEDLVYQDHVANSTAEFVEKQFVLPAGQYTIVIGSNAPANDTNRQGYKAIFTTTQDLPVSITNETYYMKGAIAPFTIAADKGVLANDTGVAAPGDVLQLVDTPTRGSVVLNADGSFTYTPGQYFGFYGWDTFTYRLLIDGDPNTPTPKGTVVISSFAGAAGIYAGLITDDDTGATSGLVKFNITATGAFTGSVILLGKKYPLTGTVTTAGGLALKNKTTLVYTNKVATHADGARHMHMHLTGADGATHFASDVDKSPFNAFYSPAPSGTHKVALAVASSSPGAPTAAGKATLVVGKDGSASIIGTLGDKTPFSCATGLIRAENATEGPAIPVYAAVYKAPGSVSGTLTFGAAANSNATGPLRVAKPTVGSAPGFTVNYDAATTLITPVRKAR